MNNDDYAFPIKLESREGIFNLGMTLRDYFAAKAMQGDCAAQDKTIGHLFKPDMSIETLNSCAALYYKMADAMIVERNK